MFGMFGKKKESNPIEFEVQRDYNPDIQTLSQLRQWTKYNDSLLMRNERTQEDWLKELQFIYKNTEELAKKYGKVWDASKQDYVDVEQMVDEHGLMPVWWVQEWVTKTTGVKYGDEITDMPEPMHSIILWIEMMIAEWRSKWK